MAPPRLTPSSPGPRRRAASVARSAPTSRVFFGPAEDLVVEWRHWGNREKKEGLLWPSRRSRGGVASSGKPGKERRDVAESTRYWASLPVVGVSSLSQLFWSSVVRALVLPVSLLLLRFCFCLSLLMQTFRILDCVNPDIGIPDACAFQFLPEKRGEYPITLTCLGY
ncbi:hypothetical protein NDU88_006406 [Pleurodeles waltl]|uniref:Uncharacterized protein n=1 Tax=Pleurodeles waltl TaxID=8319 RepID=A0AAV7NRU8_PLEWA|nr:hypothetical protein NDU88_006406 [Pleurodeles waltl]